MKSPASTSSAAAANSSMEDNTSDHRYLSSKSTATRQTTGPPSPDHGDEIDGDPAAWAAFTQNFRQVQSVLDRNRVLIQQVNENHQSKAHDNLVKNVALIQEINGNISKVVSMYSNLSTNFTTVCHQQHRSGDEKSNSSGEK
ncbi:EARLY FLOWERING-like protein [Perilla frutescens var. hirtella]|uniref:EARLY FLOWERING-like protein n=1 Tax=Perilla frutescens var. hirtella TaxID=608512 RepID=A0AAD4IRG6_PERFH|nr:EARLY FLOWERING-like protein [Perilla frutescens var. frutescens]KAH6787313.1 EARLY FLOWERING-like protein [Perilla frutescens var. hirtella]KAH6819816.1 EARLY FLOWERING-like protein [Perilla frutescens var. hirtella]